MGVSVCERVTDCEVVPELVGVGTWLVVCDPDAVDACVALPVSVVV